ncbi:hypothetical protein H696_01152 [Fonticula alba]|uniref:Proteasome assembly chaperone 3 n=1 Tax=Fonticula alba TaxID=691883 RepID=A0A058ZCR5_FONAL|nr:hypothetical protein H696_01152 [Fonticula alba]KCV71731.1 hypothetical protein H696_01152 [Fonticula alba]|eukprot:XP_009493309.1 hypothetical protein H696_01152 [Fonticula alba]
MTQASSAPEIFRFTDPCVVLPGQFIHILLIALSPESMWVWIGLDEHLGEALALSASAGPQAGPLGPLSTTILPGDDDELSMKLSRAIVLMTGRRQCFANCSIPAGLASAAGIWPRVLEVLRARLLEAGLHKSCSRAEPAASQQ